MTAKKHNGRKNNARLGVVKKRPDTTRKFKMWWPDPKLATPFHHWEE
jgi:hypothetical protein